MVDLNQALRIDPEYISALRLRGIAFARIDDYRRAIADFDRVMSLNPADVDIYYLRGRAKHLCGDPFGAVVDYDRVLRVYPGDVKVTERRKAAIADASVLASKIGLSAPTDESDNVETSFGKQSASQVSGVGIAQQFKTVGNSGRVTERDNDPHVSNIDNTSRLHVLYARSRLADREVDELIGLAHGLTANGPIVPAKVEYLQKWLVAHDAAIGHPIVKQLLWRVDQILADGVVDPEEATDLFRLLQNFSAGDFELGELIKPTSLPLEVPPPAIRFPGSRFCFTGTFTFGTRKECEAAVVERGGVCGALSGKTRYLVIGSYATDSWMHSSFGRKIENAVQMRSEGVPIAIVTEQHWVGYVSQKQ